MVDRRYLPPAELALAHAHPAGLPNHEMVEHVDVEELAGLDELFGEQHVVGRGRGVAGWVVVHHDNRGRVELDRLAEHLGDAHPGAVERANRHRFDFLILGCFQC